MKAPEIRSTAVNRGRQMLPFWTPLAWGSDAAIASCDLFKTKWDWNVQFVHLVLVESGAMDDAIAHFTACAKAGDGHVSRAWPRYTGTFAVGAFKCGRQLSTASSVWNWACVAGWREDDRINTVETRRYVALLEHALHSRWACVCVDTSLYQIHFLEFQIS